VHLRDIPASLRAQGLATQGGKDRHIRARIVGPEAVVDRLHGSPVVLLHVAALDDPRAAQRRDALPDIGGERCVV